MTIIGEYPAAVPSDTIEDTCPAAVPWCTEHRVSLDHYGTGRHYDLHSTDLSSTVSRSFSCHRRVQ